MQRRTLSLLAFSFLLSTVATSALAACPTDGIRGLPSAREGALGYSKSHQMLFVCTGTAWISTMEL